MPPLGRLNATPRVAQCHPSGGSIPASLTPIHRENPPSVVLSIGDDDVSLVSGLRHARGSTISFAHCIARGGESALFGVRRGAAWPAALLLLALSLTAPARAGTPGVDARVLKADMLYNFAKFVKWPDSSFHQTQGQLVFTILGEDPLAEALASTLSTRSVNGHPVFVRMVRRVADTAGSQIVYIAMSHAAHTAEVLHLVQGSPALTVADTSGFVERGGMVDFSDAGDHVQFEINQARAEQAGLKISAKLLAIARVVDATP